MWDGRVAQLIVIHHIFQRVLTDLLFTICTDDNLDDSAKIAVWCITEEVVLYDVVQGFYTVGGIDG